VSDIDADVLRIAGAYWGAFGQADPLDRIPDAMHRAVAGLARPHADLMEQQRQIEHRFHQYHDRLAAARERSWQAGEAARRLLGPAAPVRGMSLPAAVYGGDADSILRTMF
jgi:hypothetical protein